MTQEYKEHIIIIQTLTAQVTKINELTAITIKCTEQTPLESN